MSPDSVDHSLLQNGFNQDELAVLELIIVRAVIAIFFVPDARKNYEDAVETICYWIIDINGPAADRMGHPKHMPGLSVNQGSHQALRSTAPCGQNVVTSKVGSLCGGKLKSRSESSIVSSEHERSVLPFVSLCRRIVSELWDFALAKRGLESDPEKCGPCTHRGHRPMIVPAKCPAFLLCRVPS
jgi:hypothetical protein